MQANDLRVLKKAALPTLAAGVVAVVVSLLTAGAEGAIGAAAGTLLVGLFFTVSVVVVSYASKISPQMMAIAAVGSYLVKVVVILAVLGALGDATVWNSTAFAWSVVVCTIVWTIFEVRGFATTRMLYVDPEAKVPGRGD